MKLFLVFWRHLWPAPVSFIGALLALIVRGSGGQVKKHGIAWEASNGAAFRLLWLMNPWSPIDAITFGHVILARDARLAARLRAHEHVHVRQYERWGVIFPIAYLCASLIAMARGKDAYRDNVFEVEAFRIGGDGNADTL